MTLRPSNSPWRAVDFTPHYEVDHFLKKESATFYPFKLPSHHTQLRHYMSTVDSGNVYFISNNEVHALHIATERRERIASVGFVPTCLSAGNGWICVGGFTNGQCAFVDIRDCPPFGKSVQPSFPAEVDELLPLDLDPRPRMLAQETTRTEYQSRRRPKLISKEFGKDIINAITVCKFHHKDKDLRSESIAVISSNDKSVTIYSLSQQIVLNTFQFVEKMNHASISPDGKLLLAVGDEGRAFFLRRRRTHSQGKYPVYEWDDTANVRLTGTIIKDCCFSTSFSPSGHICAVASQFGTVTVYDTKLIREDMEDNEAVIDIFKTSRPLVALREGFPIPGAPRSMAFSPEPWDLLVWAENFGRICITDLRDGFRSRQTFEIDVDSQSLRRVELVESDYDPSAERLELEREAMFARRHQEALDSRDPFAAVQRAADYLEDAAERRRRRMRGSRSGQSLPPGSSLTETERELLESLRVERLRDNAADTSGMNRPYSINYSSSRPESHSPSLPNPPISFGQYVMNRGTSRGNQASWGAPRRRGSVVMSANSADNPSSSSSQHPSSLTPGLSVPLSTSPSRLTPISASDSQLQNAQSSQDTPASHSPTTDPWQTITAALISADAGDASTTSNIRSRLADTAQMTSGITEPDYRYQMARMEANYARLVEEGSHPTSAELIESARTDEHNLWRHRIREREREREMIVRLGRLRAMQHASNTLDGESDALSRIERLQQLRSSRFRQLRERAGSLGEGLGASMGEDDLAFLQEMSRIVERGQLLPETPSRMANGEVGVQGVGFSVNGQYLFIATEEGILKYEVNIASRMTFPGISMR